MYLSIFRQVAERRRWSLVLILALASVISFFVVTFSYAPSLAQQSTNAQEEKLLLEIQKLRSELSPGANVQGWLNTIVLPTGLLLLGWFLNWRGDTRAEKAKEDADVRAATTKAEIDAAARRFSALVDARAQAYADAFVLLKPTALFFPAAKTDAGTDDASPTKQDELVLTRDTCARMGHSLSDWYFGRGGLLMSEKPRNAYFSFVHCLGCAADSDSELASQKFGDHGSAIALSTIKKYRKELGLPERTDNWDCLEADKWKFGTKSLGDSCAQRFKDFVYIQGHASRLRTALTSDIESRDPPAGPDA